MTPAKRVSIPGSGLAERMNASRTRMSSNGVWPECSSIRLTLPGRGLSMWVSPRLGSAPAATIMSGCGLSMTSTSPEVSAA